MTVQVDTKYENREKHEKHDGNKSGEQTTPADPFFSRSPLLCLVCMRVCNVFTLPLGERENVDL